MNEKNILYLDGMVYANVAGFQTLDGGAIRFQISNDTRLLSSARVDANIITKYFSLVPGRVITTNNPYLFRDDSSINV